MSLNKRFSTWWIRRSCEAEQCTVRVRQSQATAARELALESSRASRMNKYRNQCHPLVMLKYWKELKKGFLSKQVGCRDVGLLMLIVAEGVRLAR